MRAARMHQWIFACAIFLLARGSHAADWAQFLGPTGDGVYTGPALAEKWPEEGPPVVWSKSVGEGFSSPVVGQGRLVICHRLGDELVVDCLNPKVGSGVWTYRQAMTYKDDFDSAPRPTPSIKDLRVFVHNTDDQFVCLDLKEGKKLWSHELRTEFKGRAYWHGVVSSPLAVGRAVYVHIGGPQAGLVAFESTTGKVLWRALDEETSGSSPMLAKLDGQLQILIVTRTALHGIDPDTGQVNWSFPIKGQGTGSVFAASPVVSGDYVFVSGWYGAGADLLRVKGGKAEAVWDRDDALSTHYATGIIYEGYIYGYHGHATEQRGPNLRCVEMMTGKVMWEQPKSGAGTITRFGDHLLILTDRGELLLAKASSKEFSVISRAQVTGKPTRSCLAIADGFAYVKGPKKLVCLDLRTER